VEAHWLLLRQVIVFDDGWRQSYSQLHKSLLVVGKEAPHYVHLHAPFRVCCTLMLDCMSTLDTCAAIAAHPCAHPPWDIADDEHEEEVCTETWIADRRRWMAARAPYVAREVLPAILHAVWDDIIAAYDNVYARNFNS